MTTSSGDYQKKFLDLASDEEDMETEPEETKRRSTSRSSKRMRQKECPGCGAMLSVSMRECPYCDNQFSSKSMLVTTQTAAEESNVVRAKFPFEPEREEDGSLIIAAIIGRRPRKDGRFSNKPTELALRGAVESKYEYEYLVKYKSMSYMHAQWLAAAEIESMGSKSVQFLNRYLTKLDKGDPTAQEDGEIDPSFLEVDRVLDCREEEVLEIVDEAPINSHANDSGSRLAAAIAENKKEEEALTSPLAPLRATTGTSVSGDEEEENSNKVSTSAFQLAERCRRVLERIMEDGYAVSFIEPVDTETFDDYLDVVGESICLNDIKARLDNGEYSKYMQYRKFAQDMRQIWRNCKLYNIYKSQIWHCAHYLSMMFERLYHAWVLSFSSGMVSMSDPIGRPWENSCRVCLSEHDEDKAILCDHCDASYHIYCLSPPLKVIPEGTWICDHCSSWITRTNAKLLSAAAEEEARLNTENAGQRKYVTVKKKKYLVKWRGLSYRECTWEVPEDVNDDEKIADFHRINDSPPDDPPLTAAEIAMELAKDKKFQLLPAQVTPSLSTEVYSTVVAQIRSLHFLKWNKGATDALLKESGPATFSYVYGYRTPTLVTKALKNTLEGTNGFPLEEKDKGLTWLHPKQRDEVFDEVANVLSSVVYSVARGDSMPPRPELPVNHLEVRVVMNPKYKELLINIGDYHGQCVIAGFKRRPDGTVGPVEKTGRVKLGDVLVAVNGKLVNGWKINDVAALLRRAAHLPVILLRLIRVYGPQTSQNLKNPLNVLTKVKESRRPPVKRSLFFGVFPSTADGKWLAESYYNYRRNIIGEYEEEEEAARAYDLFIKDKIASGIAPKNTRVNFDDNGVRTLICSILNHKVMAERKVSEEKLASLNSITDDRSMDSCDEETVDGAVEEEDQVPKVKSTQNADDIDDEDEDDDESTDSDSSGWDSDNPQVEWRPKDTLEASGPMARLLKAVHESDAPPVRADWVNFIVEMGMSRNFSNGQVIVTEQLDPTTGITIKLWNSVAAAARALGIPMHEITNAIKNRIHGALAGGFRWRQLKASNLEESAPTESGGIEESWKQKLYKQSREYRSGGTLRDYQVDGLNWLLRCWYSKRSSILADEMVT